MSIDVETILNTAFILLQFSKFYLAFTYLFKEKIKPVWLLGIYYVEGEKTWHFNAELNRPLFFFST